MPTSFSNNFNSHSTHHPNKPFPDFQSLKKLPESFDWASLNDPSPDNNGLVEPKSVPIIDLDHPKAQQLIGLACKSWGVFHVVNHGVPKSVLDKIEAATKSLFGLPVQQKLKAARSPNGATGYGPARISSFFPKRMWSEGFTIVGSPLEHARQLWPNGYRYFCDIIEEYQNEMNMLARKLMWLILGSLGISNQDMKWATSTKGVDPFKRANGAIQLNSYPACPDPNRAMGLAAHTDSTLVTILHQSNISGLQVFQERAGWVTVPPLQGGLVINIGDLLHILSNGLYPSVYHRAMVNRVRHRFSIAYLFGPPSETRVQPIPKLIDINHPPMYRSVTWSEYLGLKAQHFDKALSLIKLNDDNNNNNNNNNNMEKLSLIKLNDDDINNNNMEKHKSIKVDSDAKVLAALA